MAGEALVSIKLYVQRCWLIDCSLPIPHTYNTAFTVIHGKTSLARNTLLILK